MANEKYPNGFAKERLDLQAITVLNLVKDENYGEGILEMPGLNIDDYYIVAKEATGGLKRTGSMFFDQWMDADRRYEAFMVTTAVDGAGAGDEVTVTLTPESHLVDGNEVLSPVTAGHLFTDDTTGTEYIVVSTDKTTAGAHTAVIKPTDSTETAEVTTDSYFKWHGRGSVEEASDQLEGLYGARQTRRRHLEIIRTDKAYTDLSMLVETKIGDRTYYNLDTGDSLKNLTGRHLFTTEHELMLGKKRDNIGDVVGSRNTEAMGLRSQIIEWGTDYGDAVTIDDDFFKSIARSASTNGFTTDYDFVTGIDARFALDDYLSTKMGASGIQQLYTREGLSDLEVSFGFGAFKLYGGTFRTKDYALFNSGKTHGADTSNSYLQGEFLLVPNGDFVHPKAGNLPFFTVRYMSIDNEGWVNKLNYSGGMLRQPIGTKNEARFSLTSYKGLETYHIDAFGRGKIDV